MSGDTHDFQVVNDFARHTTWLHPLARLYANDGVVLFGLLLVVGIVLARRGGATALARALLAGAGTLLALALAQPIVQAVAEPRPYTRLPHALVLVHRSTDPSFPSDHATMAGAVAIGLLFVNRRLGLLAAALAVLMAADRVYVGAHYPVDVVGGLAFGGLVAAVVQLAAGPVAALLRRLSHGPLRPLLHASH
jgi:membrane-associated phospholipid phosphatase